MLTARRLFSLFLAVTLLITWWAVRRVDLRQHPAAIFPLRNPTIVALPLAFLSAVVVSRLTANSREADAFAGMERPASLGQAG